MSAHRPLLSLATLALLVAAPSLWAQGDGNTADWTLPAQTSAPILRNGAAIRGQAASPASEPARPDQLELSAPAKDLHSQQPLQPLRLPPSPSVMPDDSLSRRIPLEQQVDLLREQLREVRQRLALNEQLLSSHRHTFYGTGFAPQKYKTLRYFLENSPEAEYLAPAGPRQRETSPPMLPPLP